MAKLKITQVRSRIGATERQKRNLDALGLHKMNQTVEHEDSAIIMGMLEKVKHLVRVAAANSEVSVAEDVCRRQATGLRRIVRRILARKLSRTGGRRQNGL